MKTPEELAADYCEPILSNDYAKTIGREDWIGTRCVRVGEGHEMFKAFLAGYAAAQTNLPTPAKWISVFIETPPIENDGDNSLKFLTIDKYGDMDVLFWDWMDWQNMDVSFWMPLPEPPKEEK